MAREFILAAFLWTSPLFSAASNSQSVIDPSGNTWIAGSTSVLSITTTPTAYQKSIGDFVCGTQQLTPFQSATAIICAHAYLQKLDPNGRLLYSSYFGGGSQDGATAITTDARGNVYLAGYTYSTDFPVTAGVVQPNNAGPATPVRVVEGGFPFGPAFILPGGDAFVAKFDSDGNLVFSTLLGGSGNDVPSLIAVDSSGSIYVSGSTTSADFPLTAGAIARSSSPTFLAKLSSTGAALRYSTYSASSILAFDVDSQGRAYLTGYSSQSDSVAGGPYITVVDTGGAGLVTSSLLPAFAPKIAGAGTAILVTSAQNLILTVSPAPLPAPVYSPVAPARQLGASYVLELPPDAGRILAENDMSSTQFDSLLLDSSGNLYAFGHGTGAIPATPNPLLSAPCSADGGSFVLQFDATLKTLAATYFRLGDDRAVQVTAPGHIQIYRPATSTTASMDLTSAPIANFGCPQNLASGLAGQGVSDGEVLLISGFGLGPEQGVSAVPDSTGQFPTSLGGVQVTIGSKPALLLYVQAGEIHAVAPLYLPATGSIDVQYSNQSASLDEGFALYNPGIFAVNGQGAIVNQDGTVNSPSNPAGLGSIVSIYATGTGYLETPATDGSITPIPPPFNILETTPIVTFNGVAGVTVWSGAAPGLIAGVTQINVQLPGSLPPNTTLLAVPVVLNMAGTVSPPARISVKQ